MIIIKDLYPKAKQHYLLIPTKHYADITEMSVSDGRVLGECLFNLSKLTDKLGLSGGFRLVSNKGVDAGQTVGHLHVHILGGEKLEEF